MTTKPWPQWTESEWNGALFEYYFGCDENDAPLTRLVVTGRGLTQAVGGEPAQVPEVEERFRKVLSASPQRINARFGGSDFSFSAPYDEPPRAALHLLFTCYIASGSDEVLSEADFRRRMAVVLHHPEGTYYPLQGLGRLWERLKEWIARARASGHAWRDIFLPDPGRMVRIGYTLRLAFPHRRDRTLLAEIVAGKGFGPQPPLLSLVRALNPYLDRFTDNFRKSYEEFRRAVTDGSLDFDNSPVLDAVQDAIVHGPQASAASRECPALRLVAERDDREGLRLLLLSDRALAPRHDSRLQFFEPDRAVAPFRYAVAFSSADFEGGDTAVEFLLAGELAEHLRYFDRTPLSNCVRDGVLLFHHASTGTLECAVNLNIEGAVCVLVHSRMAVEFQRILTRHMGKAPSFPSAYDEWREFEPIEAAVLRAIDWASDPALARAQCLQRCAPGDRMTLVGGLPTSEPRTWFGHLAVLPMVRVRGGALSVRLLERKNSASFELARVTGETEIFSLRSQHKDAPLEGEYMFTARTENGRTLRKEVSFRAFVDSYEYLSPTKPDRWLCESSFTDMARWDAEAAFAGAAPAQSSRLPLAAYGGPAALACIAGDDCARIVALTEICAATCNRRRGFAESEWIELFGKVFAVADRTLARLALRAWVEAGHFDQAVDESWRTRRLFARRPRLVASRDATGLRARLVGLAPAVLINQLRRRVAKTGGQVYQCASASPWVAGPWEIRGLDGAVLENLTQELTLADLQWAPAETTLHAPLKKLIRQLPQLPLNYELFQRWSWARSRFVDPAEAENQAVQLEWWQRRQRLDRPDYFLVHRGGTAMFTSYSRNWALLVAASLMESKPFRREGTGLRSEEFPWVFLPLSVGRFCYAAGISASGPVKSEDGIYRYGYALGSTAMADSILIALGLVPAPIGTRAPAWLKALATEQGRFEALVPLGAGADHRRRVPASLRPLFLAHRRRD